METIRKAFEILSEAHTIEDVNNILNTLNVGNKYRMDDKSYPQITFKITSEEIQKLRNKKLLNSDNLLTDVSNESSLTKLLYAVAWKNGDLKKIRHIIEGIESNNDDEKDSALVFYQFGKYLTQKAGEPIIDQHVLRAFGIFKASKNDEVSEIKRLTNLSLVTKREKSLIEEYKKWLNNDLTDELRQCENYAYHVDKVLFAIGKQFKSVHRKK